MLVDTGPDDTYPVLRTRLAAIAPNADGHRHIDLFVVTHIDHDHIGGAGRLLADRSLKLNFGDVWFNAPGERRVRVDADADRHPQRVEVERLGKRKALFDRLPRLARPAEQKKAHPADAVLPQRLARVPHVFGRVPLVHLAKDREAAALEPQAHLGAPGARQRGDELVADAVRVEDASPLDAECRSFETPVACYPWSFMVYTYGKAHLAPGMRLGYIAASPQMPDADELRLPLLVAQMAAGWAFPVAPLQHAMADLDRFVVDVGRLQARRDRLVAELRGQGYELVEPEGTFYILARSPVEDDEAFCRALATLDVLVLPGSTFEMPGWLRISVTANDDMVERALPGFARAIAEARR